MLLMNNIYSNYYSLISEFVVGESGEQRKYSFLRNKTDFDRAINELKKHVSDRNDEVIAFLNSDK